MTDMELLSKFEWANPQVINDSGSIYDGCTCCTGVAKTRWKDGSKHRVGLTMLFKPGHKIFDMKLYIDKFQNAVLSIRDELAERGAEILEP